jgi:Predicted transcription factor, homolog of eukaryotic MBF1
MQNHLDLFGTAVRMERAKRQMTQRELAAKLNMSVRTITQIELLKSSPKFETVVLIAKELNIGLDTIVFQNTATGMVSKRVTDFFLNKSDAEAQKYIELCQKADELKSDK